MTIIIHPAVAALLIVAVATAVLRLGVSPKAADEPATRPAAKRQRYVNPPTLTETSYVNGRGYVMAKAPGHPLANRHGYVTQHRKVLFDAIGPGVHPCAWCGAVVEWSGTGWATKLVVDHFDGDRQNNDPTNLRPSCLPCNSARTAPKVDVDEPAADVDPEERIERRRRLARERQARHRARRRVDL